MRWIPLLACSAALFAGAQAARSQAVPAKAAQIPLPAAKATQAAPISSKTAKAPLLPEAFAGWVAAEAPKEVTDAAQADPANAAALKEYGFTDAALADYKREGETLSLRALRFHDASGAYGAYSFYRQNGWPKEEIGTGATSDHNRVLFWVGNTVVDANFSHISPMSGGGVARAGRPVARARGRRGAGASHPGRSAAGNRAGQLDGQTTHYALGPASYAGSGGVLPPDAGRLRSRRGDRDRELHAALGPGHADAHRLSHAADGRGAGDARFATTSRPANRPAKRQPGPSRSRTPTWLRWKCGAADRWWRW